jgi:hypothetical protein
MRLEELGFVTVERKERVDEWRFAIDYEAIARY